jgi:hypothetical protein
MHCSPRIIELSTILIVVYFHRLEINHESHEFILESSTVGNTSSFPAKACPGHHLGGMLDLLLSESLLEPVRAHWASAAGPLVAKSELKATLVTEHNFFLVVYPPMAVLVGKFQPLLLHPLGQEGLLGHHPGGEL